ncbi:MAG TPA: alginate lyase family protein [Vicinamibacteria bacterium]|jgi:hypothetical protein
MLQVVALLAVMTAVPPLRVDVWAIDRDRILKAASAALRDAPVTVTAASSPRSAGGPHDDFSEADYWWPDPADPGGPYVQRDGMSNPDNFDEHRLRYAQAIHGRVTAEVQAAAFARLAGNDEVVRYCRDRFKTVLLPSQMAADGSFPEQLRRTKPYGYSLLNLEAMAALCQLLDASGRSVELHASRWARHASGHAIHGPLHPRQEELAEAARRDVRPRVAHAAGHPPRRASPMARP